MADNNKKSLVELYHNSHSLVRHHLDSFNHFIDVDMKKIVQAQGIINIPDLKFQLQITDVYVRKPSLNESHRIKADITPHQCRLRSLTYAGDISVDLMYKSQGMSKTIAKKNVPIGRMPIMVRSNKCALFEASVDERVKMGECRYDPGGYFITRGSERVFLMQEQMAKNRMIIEHQKMLKRGGMKIPLAQKTPNPDFVCSVVSSTVENKSRTTVFKNSGFWYVENTMFTESIPLFIMFAAFGMPAHCDIMQCIAVEDHLLNDLLESALEMKSQGVFSQKQALQWLSSRIKYSATRSSHTAPQPNAPPQSTEEAYARIIDTKQSILRRVVTHVPASIDDMSPRARFLGLMVRRVMQAERNQVLVDDRDFYGTKRIDLIGFYLSLAFDDKFQSFMDCLKKEIEKTLRAKNTTPIDPCSHMKMGIITEGLFGHIFTGNWTLRRFGMDRAKVTEVLNRLSYIATLGNLCKMTSSFEKVRKVSGPRSIHLSQYGLVCTADTPEGEQCGLIKNLAFMVEITVEVPVEPLAALIRASDLFDGDMGLFCHGGKKRLVMLNGVAIGWTKSPHELGRHLRQLRRRGLLHKHVSIYFQEDDDSLHVSSDSGKMVRPYIVVENGRSLFTTEIAEAVAKGTIDWQQLVSTGVIEYLDAREGYAECLLAWREADLTELHTHLDIDPATALGPVASLIPFPHHNQSPRNTYQCAMGKQALGVIGTNQSQRFDGTQHVLVNPQRPLTLSTTAALVNYPDIPAGQNAIVAITCFGGHDVEDALIINKASLERGLLRSFTVKSYSDIVKETEMLGAGGGAGRAAAIESDGTPAVGAPIRTGEVVINKVTGSPPVPAPTSFQGSMERAQVQRVLVSEEDKGSLLVRVRCQQMRMPEVGDKLSSRHGQKGVIGRVVPVSEMPFSEDGTVPDIIMNPHGFPSRMTVGKLIELLANKAAVLDGETRNSSAFVEAGHQTVEDDYPSVLGKNGYSFSGKETLTSGVTGETMEADVYTGPVFYQRLKHMVQDKVHARSTGKVAPLTRQPTTGRANEGGLRVGEMERDCLIAYGATQVIKERMMLSSDPFQTWVCASCGMFATSSTWCQMCRSSQHVSSVTIPYATKLLVQELNTMHLKLKFELTKNDAMVSSVGGQ